ncbi:CoA pyrophosphatase [Thalassotalea agarivorans]|uniref:8-oxo-dGTP pyrophosphatase MutT, NUDIX family n=1 Tax=Thalassotalea agarivorans TaxID=349064 RepID=A0A1I0DG26_THASX|nr:CoA pyrophosphatase [Thalassotalea agarivorans]SET31245.1 8-oxo-dGTP pyrophosphatase MutT, NUDIX family [Thalassotalea agarivorans]
MNKQEFKQKFLLRTTQKKATTFTFEGNRRPAAVLVALYEENDQLHLLLTKRATHLKHHAGQISFPGGKVEPSDIDSVATALRETEEETGIEADKIEIIGQLAPYDTITGFIVSPIVALLKQKPTIVIDPNEVAEVFYVPFSHFLDRTNHVAVPFERNKKTHNVLFMPYQQYNIWGATAAIIADLIAQLD